MGYSKKIEESKRRVYNQSVATRILDLVDKLRLNSNDNDQRRWIWELIQNAKDVAFDEQPVSIRIDMGGDSEKFIDFQHNGKPFSIDNITFLIEQVSTKERAVETGVKPKTTGKFGTGFLTTHLLSEKVQVEGVAKESSLPYKRFKLLLDRSGTNIEEIIISVNESLKLLNDLDDSEEYLEYDKNDFNTSFRYLLDENGISTAKKGFEDLELSIAFTLAFVPSIKSICINSTTTYVSQPQVTMAGENIEIHTIHKNEIGKPIEEYNIAIVSNERVSVAVEIKYVNNTIVIVEPNEQLPKLFCGFPLIGSEDFNFPIIINSSIFNPTEPRNGIFISDKTDIKIVENKNLLIEARDLYTKLLNHAATQDWQNIWVLAKISLPKPKDSISREWFSVSILDPIRKEILKTPLIDTILYGRIPMDCGEYNNLPKGATVDFPKHPDKPILTKLWEICNNPYFILPVESDYHQWSKIIWDEKYLVGLNSITKLIEAKGTMGLLSKSLQKNLSDCKQWLNDFYTLLEVEGVLIKDIEAKAIYPNQNGVFKKKDDLLFEKSIIPEILKDIAKELGEDFRERLLDLEINVKLSSNFSCDSETVADEISKLIKPRLAELQRTPETKSIFKKLYLWFNQNKEQADEIFDYLYKNKHKLLDDEAIVSSLKKADLLDSFIELDSSLSIERILQLLELEEMSKGFSVDQTYTPSEEQKRINFVNGWKGEAFVYKSLVSKGFDVIWANKSISVTLNQIIDFEGEAHYIDDKMEKYDLEILLPDNRKLFIQVKSTSTDINRADEIAMPISVREWNFINEKASEESYYLARVFDVASSPDVYFMKIEKIETI